MWSSLSPAVQRGESQSKNTASPFAYEAIGTGGLALHARHALGWVSRLADEVVIAAYNSRPDVASTQSSMLLMLKNGKEQLTIPSGRLLYLKETGQGKGLISSDTPTGLWIKPILMENGTILIEAGRKFSSKEGKTGEEKGEFIATAQGGNSNRANPSGQSHIKELKTGRHFSQDLLLQKYGGREYASWGEKQVLELMHGSSPYACFVTQGDYLSYEEGEWRVTSFDDLKEDRPVACVRAASTKGLEIEAWDETGFYPMVVKLEAEKVGRIQMKQEAMPSAARLRSGSAVSCAFGKRRVILKQGDWLLKTQAGWRHLRRAQEIEDYLHHRLRGELLIFDAIEKEQGRFVMKGSFFDESRTYTQPLALPIDGDKVQGKSTRKRKTAPMAPAKQEHKAL